jgi:cytochrome c oxidase subunit 1
VIGLSLFMTLAYLLASLRKPMDAPDNPWGGTTLEWQCSSPPIMHNFQEQPVVERDPYDYRPAKA